MKHSIIAMLTLVAFIFSGCDKKENRSNATAAEANPYENFASKPKDISSDDRSPIRYQK